MKKAIVCFIAALVVCAFPAKGFAAAEAGDVEVSLLGGGLFDVGSDANQDYNVGSVGIRLGYYWTPMLETALGVSATYLDYEAEQDVLFLEDVSVENDDWGAHTEALVNFHIPMAEDTPFDPYLGGAIGFLYVRHDSTFTAGVQGGLKYWVNEDVSLFAEVQYRRLQAPDLIGENDDANLVGGVVGISRKF